MLIFCKNYINHVILFNMKLYKYSFTMRKTLKIWITRIDHFITYMYLEYNHPYNFLFK